jgi:hypothetical protein
MARFRLLLLGLLAVLAVGAVASASASAETCTGGSFFVFCNDNNEPLHNTEVLGLSGLALLSDTTLGAEAKFHCGDDHFKATLELLGKIKGLILFLHCVEEKPTGCKLSTAQEKEIDATFTGEQKSQTVALFTGAGASETFTTLEIVNTGGCSLATNNYPVKGKQLVETPKGGSSLVNQEIVAKKSGSFLEFNGHKSVSFSSTTTNAHLASGLAWLVMAGE